MALLSGATPGVALDSSLAEGGMADLTLHLKITKTSYIGKVSMVMSKIEEVRSTKVKFSAKFQQP